MTGWALDPNTTSPIAVHVYVNGAFAGHAVANVARSDINSAFPGYGPNHGYDFTVPGAGGTVCVYAINSGAGTTNPSLGCKTVT